jgi:hypothetical protein
MQSKQIDSARSCLEALGHFCVIWCCFARQAPTAVQHGYHSKVLDVTDEAHGERGEQESSRRGPSWGFLRGVENSTCLPFSNISCFVGEPITGNHALKQNSTA